MAQVHQVHQVMNKEKTYRWLLYLNCLLKHQHLTPVTVTSTSPGDASVLSQLHSSLTFLPCCIQVLDRPHHVSWSWLFLLIRRTTRHMHLCLNGFGHRCFPIHARNTAHVFVDSKCLKRQSSCFSASECFAVNSGDASVYKRKERARGGL